MFVRAAKLAIVLVLASSIGLHWVLVQSVAWVGMVVNYSQGSSISEALSRTFDGKHPCALCKAIDKDKRSQKRTDALSGVAKTEIFWSCPAFVFRSPTWGWETFPLERAGVPMPHAPPVPPPRALA